MSKKIEPKNELPLVSVIIPVRNEAPFVERSLQAVLDQTYPKERMEVIFADGMSTDETRQKILTMAARTQVPISIVDNIKQIAPTGLNAAISKAVGEVLVRVDGHCEIDPAYVANCVELLNTGRADGVGGPIETIGETGHAAAIALAMSSRFGVGGSAFRTVNDREMYTDTVAFPGYTRKVIDKVGQFDEELVRNQDDEYNFRIRELGGQILLSPAIRSRYYSRSTFRSLWRQYFQYGYWKVRVMQLHPKQMSVRQFIPFLFVCALIVFALLSLFSSAGRLVFVGVITLYVIANISASLLAAKSRISMVPSLSLSFAILHIAYGLGSLVGVIAFWDRWGNRSKRTAGQQRQLS